MSFNIVVAAANDVDLQNRVSASIYAEAINNPNLNQSDFAMRVKNGYAPPFTPLYWAVAQAVQAEYENGVLNGRGAPGHDHDVVTDGAITSAVVANWPTGINPT